MLSFQNDSKKSWNVLNLLLNRNSKKSYTISEIDDNNYIKTDLSSIYNVFRSYFTGTHSSIASTLPQHNYNFDHYLTGNYYNYFFLAAITPTSIRNIVSDLNSSASGGHNDIPCKVVRSIIDILAEPLGLIFNNCVSEGYFPDDLKIVQIIPIFKAGDLKKTQ